MPRFDTMNRRRGDLLTEIGANVDALVKRVVTAEKYDRAPGKGEDGIYRRSPERQVHRVTAHGLIPQLVAALAHKSGAVGESAGRSAPGSASPSAALISDTLDQINRESAEVLHRLRGMGVVPARIPDQRRTVVGDILAIRAAVHALGDPAEVAEVAASPRFWVHQARIALTYEAPVKVLRDHRCPFCQGELHVRADDSSPVRCAGHPGGGGSAPRPPCRDGEGRPRSWPKGAWVLLLDRLESQGEARPAM